MKLTKTEATIEWTNGDKEWYLDGKLHRTDGPAIEKANGDKYWYLNGKRHRIDGTAIEFFDGSQYWFVNDKLQKFLVRVDLRGEGKEIAEPKSEKTTIFFSF